MTTAHRLYRRGALLSLLNVLLSPVVIGVVCFGILFGIVGGLFYLLTEYSHRTVPWWINPIGDIEWSYLILLVPLYAAIVGFAAAIVLLCGYFMAGTMLRQWELTAFYVVFFVISYLAVVLLGGTGKPLDLRLNFVELSLASSAAIWSLIWGRVWRRLMRTQ